MRAFCFSLVMAAVVGCGGDSDGTGSGTGGAPGFASLGVSPIAPSLFVGDQVTLVVTPRDQNNNVISGLGSPTFQSSAPNVAMVNNGGVVSATGAGSSTITASLTASGIKRTAISRVDVAPRPSDATVLTSPANAFNPSRVVLARGGSVTWMFGAVTHNVVFSPRAGAPENIVNTSNAAVPRTFTTADDYPYSCTIHPSMTGMVLVR